MKKKIILMYMAVLAVCMLAGGASYALFSASTSNNDNTFSAGTIEITSKRGDVPAYGPMFYTESSQTAGWGTMPTGLWAPGDSHTRGLFLENTGSLKARLQNLNATAANSNGEPISSGAAYDDAILFSNNSYLLVWNLKRVNITGGLISWTNINATQMDEIMDLVNAGYEEWAASNGSMPDDPLYNSFWPWDEQNIRLLLEYLNMYLYEHLNGITGSDNVVQVDKLFALPLNDVINGVNVADKNITIEPDEAVLLAYTVTFDRIGTEDQNALQGKNVYFNFGSNWVQTANN